MAARDHSEGSNRKAFVRVKQRNILKDSEKHKETFLVRQNPESLRWNFLLAPPHPHQIS